MKNLKHNLTVGFVLAMVLIGQSALSQTGYVIDQATGKRVTYVVKSGQIIFSDGRIAVPSIASTDFKKAYLNAPPIVTPPVVAVPPGLVWKTVGNGSGRLELGTLINTNIKIKPGSYDDISYDKAVNLIIDGSGVKINNGYSLNLRASNNVKIIGMSVTNTKYRGVNIRGFNTGVVLDNMYFENIGDYVICFENPTVWDGTDNTVILNSAISNCTFINTGSAINVAGRVTSDGKIEGLSRGFKILNNKFKNSPTLGEAANIGICQDIEIAGNVVDNINTKFPPEAPNGTHNGIFTVTGTGSFHDNMVTNHQGNAVRFNGFIVGKTKSTIKIYNNLVWNSWKYGGFEIQVPPDKYDILSRFPAKYSFADYEIYNNTVGDMNRSGDWEGQLLDLYSVNGAVSYHHNLGFRMNKVVNINNKPVTKYDAITNMINYNGMGTSLDEHDNYYFPTQVEAGEFLKSVNNIGSPLMYAFYEMVK